MNKFLFPFVFIILIYGCKDQHNAQTPNIYCNSSLAQTFPMLNGNRCVVNKDNFKNNTLDVKLNGKPLWITSTSIKEKQFWAVALTNGHVELIETKNKKLISKNRHWGSLAIGTPPVFGINCENELFLANNMVDSLAHFAAPVLLSNNKLAYISSNGDLIIKGENHDTTLAINAMHDSRILIDENNRLLVLTHPKEYFHNVLGNNIEAKGIAIIETSPEIKLAETFFAPDSSVIEGVGVIWEDMNGDGKKEIITTLSNNTEGDGAKHVIFSEKGDLLASGNIIKPGGWRHLLLTFRPPNSKTSLIASIQRPHVDRILNIYEWKDNTLEVTTSLEGFSTHIAGSRNLDGVLGMDINQDDYQDIILPNTTHDTLYAISTKNSSLETIWKSPLGGESLTNISYIKYEEGSAFAVGTDKDVLKIWFSE